MFSGTFSNLNLALVLNYLLVFKAIYPAPTADQQFCLQLWVKGLNDIATDNSTSKRDVQNSSARDLVTCLIWVNDMKMDVFIKSLLDFPGCEIQPSVC